MKIPTCLCVLGTRPEAIKMAPVIIAIRKAGFKVKVLATAQHRHLLDQVLDIFDIKPDWDLDAMKPEQRLSDLVSRMLPEIDVAIRECRADIVAAQGDTSTVFATALASFHCQVPFAHVEAGLRSGNLAAPFPEEANRRLVGVLSRLHFAPTETARKALLREGVDDKCIHVVGNTVIDALMDVSARPDLPWPACVPTNTAERLVLVTLHRRENFGLPLDTILHSLRSFALRHPTARLVYPVHPNPNVKGPAEAHLGDLPNVHLIAPVDYPTLIHLMKKSFIVFTDSGGIQEEAPALGKPVLVFREVTERPEAVEAGGVRLVGADPVRFMEEAELLWNDPAVYALLAQPRFPYGVGDSSTQIARVLSRTFGL